MANLGYKTITNKKYEDIETLLGINLVAGEQYTIQARNPVFMCVKQTQPNENEGFFVDYNVNAYVTKKEEGDKVYIKTTSEYSNINIGG